MCERIGGVNVELTREEIARKLPKLAAELRRDGWTI